MDYSPDGSQPRGDLSSAILMDYGPDGSQPRGGLSSAILMDYGPDGSQPREDSGSDDHLGHNFDADDDLARSRSDVKKLTRTKHVVRVDHKLNAGAIPVQSRSVASLQNDHFQSIQKKCPVSNPQVVSTRPCRSYSDTSLQRNHYTFIPKKYPVRNDLAVSTRTFPSHSVTSLQSHHFKSVSKKSTAHDDQSVATFCSTMTWATGTRSCHKSCCGSNQNINSASTAVQTAPREDAGEHLTSILPVVEIDPSLNVSTLRQRNGRS